MMAMTVGGKGATKYDNPQYLIIYDKNSMDIKSKWGFCHFLMTFQGNQCVSNVKDNIYLSGPTNLLQNSSKSDDK